jgi:GGDEF domain-containing protein
VLVVAQPATTIRLRSLFEPEAGTRVLAPRSREETLDLVQRWPIDLALVDEAAWAERGSGPAAALTGAPSATPLIVIGAGGREDAVAAVQAGALEYLAEESLERPATMDHLHEVIDRSRRSRRDQTRQRWLARTSDTDVDTGLLVREALLETATAHRRRARRLAVVVATIPAVDGSPVPAETLRLAASIVVRAARAGDVAGRISTTSIALAVADGDVSLGRQLARRIAQEADRYNLTGASSIAFTFGVASGPASQAEQVVSAAEREAAAVLNPRFRVGFPTFEDEDGPSVA